MTDISTKGNGTKCKKTPKTHSYDTVFMCLLTLLNPSLYKAAILITITAMLY